MYSTALSLTLPEVPDEQHASGRDILPREEFPRIRIHERAPIQRPEVADPPARTGAKIIHQQMQVDQEQIDQQRLQSMIRECGEDQRDQKSEQEVVSENVMKTPVYLLAVKPADAINIPGVQ